MNSKIKYFPFNKNILNTHFRISYSLNKKFYNLPGLSKFHNINDEKINNLIKSDDEPHKSIKIFNIHNTKKISNYKSYEDLNTKKNAISYFNNIYKKNAKLNNKSQKYNNIILSNNRNNFLLFNMDSKKTNLDSNERYSNSNNLSNIRSRNVFLFDKNIVLPNSKSEKILIEKLLSNKKIKLSRVYKTNNSYEMQKCLTSDSMKILDIPIKNRKNDIRLILYEKTDESFEDNFFYKKTGDKYHLFKKQISKHKNKLEKLIKEIRLNQIKNEYLMKKYIYNLISKKKKKY